MDPVSRMPRAAPDWLVAMVAMVASCVISALVLDLSDAKLSVPLSYTADANSAHMVVKSVLEHGWYQDNPDLGFPFGQDLRSYAFVSGDNLPMLIIKLIGGFGASPAAAMNLFFLIGFPLCALTAYVVLRAWRIGQGPALVAAVLFSVLPFHFLHGQEHLFISAYYAVPLGVYLVVAAWRGEALLLGGGRRRTVLIVLACVVIGSAFVYYAAFTVILVTLAALVRLIASRDLRAAISVGLPAILVFAVVVFNHAPNILHDIREGGNEAIARSAVESEQFGLKGAAMVLPVSEHRLGPLADLREDYDRDDSQTREGPPQALGAVAALGALGLIVALLGTAVALGRGVASPLIAALGATVVSAFLMGTAGGGSLVLALIATPELRAWSRISIFIAFCGLAAAAIALDRLRRVRGEAIAAVAAVTVLIVGVLDQTTGAMAPDHARTQAAWSSDRSLVAAIERSLPRGAAVFELPYQAFPEPQISYDPPAQAAPYDGVRPYLHSGSLKWSYGEVKGLHHDWQFALASAPASVIPAVAAATGFRGLLYDRGSYHFGAPAVERALARATGASPLVSDDRRLAFYDLGPLARRLRRTHGAAALEQARAATLTPLDVEWASGFSGPKSGLEEALRLAIDDATVLVGNPSDTSRSAVFDAQVETATRGAASLDVVSPGDTPVRIPLEPAERVRETLEVPAAGAAMHFRTNAEPTALLPDVRLPFSLRFLNPVVIDTRQLHLVGDLEPSPPGTLLTPYGVR